MPIHCNACMLSSTHLCIRWVSITCNDTVGKQTLRHFLAMWPLWPSRSKINPRPGFLMFGDSRCSMHTGFHAYPQTETDRQTNQTKYQGNSILMLHCIGMECSIWIYYSLQCWLGNRNDIWPVKSWVLVCWWWRSDWSFARPIASVVTTTSITLSSNKTG